MPEYSSTTITPADGVQVPSMNGSAAGNFLLSALRDYILASKGQANGLASLDGNGKLTAAQLPDLADDVIVVDSYSTLPAIGTASKIYITADNNKGYRWDPELTTPDYVKIFEIDKSIVFGYYSSGSFYEDSEHTVQITPVEHVFYVDVSLADIYVLNDGTLIELLGTKWAKITDIQDGTITAGLATKAFQDAMGRAIITTYETKADASDLKSAIQANSKRITNLEVKAGDEIPVTYPSATYGMDGVPASVAPYTKVRELIMNSRVRNQMINTASYSPRGNTIITVDSDGYFNLSVPNWTSGTCGITLSGSFDSSHFYLTFIFCKTYNLTESPNWRLYDSGSSYLADGDWRHTNGYAVNVVSPNANSSYSGVYFTPASNAESVSLRFQSKDLTKYFGTFDLSFLGATDSDKLATIQTNYPELLIPSDYDTGTRVDTTYSAVVSKGFNLWNEVWELGVYNAVTGEKYPNDQRIRSASYIDVTPNTSYYAKVPSPFEINIFFYDENKNFLYNVGKKNTTFDAPPNCRYITFYVGGGDITSYGNNICINISGTEDGTYKSYRDPVTLTLPSPVTGKSAGSVHQIYYPETGEMTEPLGEYTFTGDETPTESYQRANGDWYCIFQSIFNDGKNNGEGLSNMGIPFTTGSVAFNGTGTYFVIRGSGGVAFYLAGATSASAVTAWISANLPKIYYELATPNPNSQATDPVLDPFIKVEGNGTIRPVQSQTTQIDSAMSVDYLGV